MGEVSGEATPSGGDTVEVTFFDADGAVVDGPDDAATYEVVESREGMVLARTYFERGTGVVVEPFPTDATDETVAGDETKATWDVWVLIDDGADMKLVETVEEYLRAVGAQDRPLADNRRDVAQLMVLPSFENAPEAFRDDVRRWLVATRPGGETPE